MARGTTILVLGDGKQDDFPVLVQLLRDTAGAPFNVKALPGLKTPCDARVLNAALRAHPYDDIVLVHPDVSIETEDWLAKWKAQAEADPQLGVIGGKIFDRLGLLYSCGRVIVSTVGMREPFSNIGYGESDTSTFAQAGEVDSVLPWLCFLRREAIDACGGFDERFAVEKSPEGRPPWIEMDDFCIATRAKNFTVQFDPQVKVIETKQSSYRTVPEFAALGVFDEQTSKEWRKKWFWFPDAPDLHAIRHYWLKTSICWRIGEALLDTWPSPKPEVDLLMVTRNNLPLLKKTLESLRATLYRQARLWVFLNGSTDESRAYLEQLTQDGYPFPIEIAESPVNLGCPIALNWLLKLSNAPLVARIDDDIEVPPDWLNRLVQRLRSRPYAGAIGVKVVHAEKPDIIQWADYRFLPTPTNHQNEKDTGQFDFLGRTFANMGCCVLYRRKAMEKAGPFDMALTPVSWEDLEHQIAVSAAGYEVLWDGLVTVKHPFKPLRDHCRRALINNHGNGSKVVMKWGGEALRSIEMGLELAGRRVAD